MKRWIGPFLILVIAASTAHWATLVYAPSVIMDRALTALKDRGIAEHAFTSPVRITPETQAVVRSSPDVYYALCRYDLSDPGSILRVVMSEWPDYQSLSLFDADTNNFATFRGTDRRVALTLHPPGSDDDLSSPTERGVILIRRIAPTQEAFDAAEGISENDMCMLTTFGEMR